MKLREGNVELEGTADEIARYMGFVGNPVVAEQQVVVSGKTKGRKISKKTRDIASTRLKWVHARTKQIMRKKNHKYRVAYKLAIKEWGKR